MKRSQSGHKPKYSGVSSAGVSIGVRARLRRKLLGCKDTLEGTTELQAMLPRDTPGNRWAGPHGIEREEKRFIYVPILMEKKILDIKYQGKGGKTKLKEENTFPDSPR